MLIETKRVKNYCSTYKTIILIDKEPLVYEIAKRMEIGE